MIGLPDLPGGAVDGWATAVTPDGSAIVGLATSGSGKEAFHWTPGPDGIAGTGDDTMVGLGDLAGGAFESRAYGVSSDGTVVVGEGRSASGKEAFRTMRWLTKAMH